MVNFFNRSLIILIISFPILYSPNSYATKLSCECEYSSIKDMGSLCSSLLPMIEIQIFLSKNYLKFNSNNFEITSKNKDEIFAINRSLPFVNNIIKINRNSGKATHVVQLTQDVSLEDGLSGKKGDTSASVFQCSKKKDKLF